jgi:hypothetical protein
VRRRDLMERILRTAAHELRRIELADISELRLTAPCYVTKQDRRLDAEKAARQFSERGLEF